MYVQYSSDKSYCTLYINIIKLRFKKEINIFCIESFSFMFHILCKSVNKFFLKFIEQNRQFDTLLLSVISY